MLSDPGPSPFDLNFRLLGTHVRVSPFFWLCSTFLGWGLTSDGDPATGNSLGDLGVWIGCVFVSILLHEFGHVWAFRAFRVDAHIVLHGFGGLAIPNDEPRRRWQRIVVSAAGPAIQLALLGVLVGMIWGGWLPRPWTFLRAGWLPGPDVAAMLAQGKTPLTLFVQEMVLINLLWPLFNLLPIWPLDGGRIAREVSEAISPARGVVVSLGISLALCAVLAVNELMGRFGEAPLRRLSPYLSGGSMFNAVFFALLAYGSYQALQYENSRRRRPWEEDWPWER
jgi:Zn-dependent protease